MGTPRRPTQVGWSRKGTLTPTPPTVGVGQIRGGKDGLGSGEGVQGPKAHRCWTRKEGDLQGATNACAQHTQGGRRERAGRGVERRNQAVNLPFVSTGTILVLALVSRKLERPLGIGAGSIQGTHSSMSGWPWQVAIA